MGKEPRPTRESLAGLLAIATSGSADSFVAVSHITRTRSYHQVTAVSLYILRKKAYSTYLARLAEDEEPLLMTEWLKYQCEEQPQALYWQKVLDMELAILQVSKIKSCFYLKSHFNTSNLFTQ